MTPKHVKIRRAVKEDGQDPATALGHKSTFVAYVLWLVGGLLGAHHVYLGREKQAALYVCTLGGFGLGWVRDFFRLPNLVADANNDPAFVDVFKAGLLHSPRRSFLAPGVVCGQVLCGLFIRAVAVNVLPTFPDERVFLYPLWAGILGAAGATLAIYGIETADGRRACRLRTVACCAAAWEALSWGLFLVGENHDPSRIPGGLFTVMGTMLGAALSRYYRLPAARIVTHRSFVRRALVVSMVAILFWAVAAAGCYHNGTVQSADGETIRLKESVARIFRSPAWSRFTDTLSALWAVYRDQGSQEFLRTLALALDVDGQERARADLGVTATTTPEDIKAAYKRRVMLFHPDKCKLHDVAECEAKFQVVQRAYELLTDRKSPSKRRGT